MSNSTNVVPFDFEGSDVRIIDHNGDAWFILKDVLAAMGSSTPTNVAKSSIINGLGEGYNSVIPLETAGGIQNSAIINESAATFLVAQSRTDKGKRLNKWIHGEVLPSIRQHGGYINGQNEMDDDELLARAVLHAQSVITQKNAVIAQQQQTLTAQEPMVNFFNSVGSTNTLMSMTQAVKTMNIQLPNGKPLGRNEAFSQLRNQGILQTTGSNWNLPYQVFINQGYFKVKTTVLSNGQTKTVTQVTGKGLQWLYDKLK